MSDRLALCYHAVSPTFPAALSVTPEAFRSQLTLLVERGYGGVTFTALVRGEGPAKALAVTFDDAYRSVREVGLPILSELGLPATVFVPTAFAGSERPMSWPGIDRWAGGPHEEELVPLSWDELRDLSRQGWEVGSHTHSHPRLTELDAEGRNEELSRSRHVCEEKLGGPCTSIAYPYGDHDEGVVSAAAAAGYEAGGTLPSPPHPASPLRWPRVGIYHRDDMRRFRLKVSRALRSLRTAAGRMRA